MISINPLTFIIFVPKADLTLVSGTFYKHDTNVFRLALRELEAEFDGMAFTKTHKHNTEATVAGTTYARLIEIIAPYSVEYEDGQYSVQLEGSNNNIWDIEAGILVQNQVQVIPTNAAGLIVGAGGLSPSQDAALTRIQDILEGDMIPTSTEWQILQKVTKAVLVQKDANTNGDGLVELTEP